MYYWKNEHTLGLFFFSPLFAECGHCVDAIDKIVISAHNLMQSMCVIIHINRFYMLGIRLLKGFTSPDHTNAISYMSIHCSLYLHSWLCPSICC